MLRLVLPWLVGSLCLIAQPRVMARPGLLPPFGRNTAIESATQNTSQGHRTSNRLANEKSPYLLQHAYNPVDWYPWGGEAFEKARKENKLIFLSVGYSTCYWCHVMERQVFENEELAGLLNKYFVSIKVDREERPDIDRVYMSALQAMTGSGGWPMSLLLTPDLAPFFGATYLPPDKFRGLIDRAHEAWTNAPDKIQQSGREVIEYIKRTGLSDGANVKVGMGMLGAGFESFREQYDEQYSGFGSGPKFPMPSVLDFLLRYSHRFENRQALNIVLATLHKMGEGGIYDHVGGGFHRYSVDGQWRTPHFEKMLYDQAQLVSVYLDAYEITRDEFYSRIARQTIAYVLREMTSAEGGFYSAQDAESATDPTRPDIRQEGAFYLWRANEIESILGKHAADVFSYYYGVEPAGNALQDPEHVFASKNILYQSHTIDETASKFGIPPREVTSLLSLSRQKLFAARKLRPAPALDDKVLVSWNGLMISALARGYQVFRDPDYLRAAERAADFILSRLYDAQTGRLFRRYRSSEHRYDGGLDDYAFFSRALVDLYETTLNLTRLKQAIRITSKQIKLFLDQRSGGFFDTSGEDSSVILRTKQERDGSEPSGNSVATLNLLRLAQMTNDRKLRDLAEQSLGAFAVVMEKTPSAMPGMLAALDFHLDKPVQIIIAGIRNRADTRTLLAETYNVYLPNRVILLADGGTAQKFLATNIPFLDSVKMIGGRATAYICRDYACQLPTSDPSRVRALLAGKHK